jgi:hypothetical protein
METTEYKLVVRGGKEFLSLSLSLSLSHFFLNFPWSVYYMLKALSHM